VVKKNVLILHLIGLSAGELTVVLLVAFFIVSAPYWPRAGARIAERLHRRRAGSMARDR